MGIFSSHSDRVREETFDATVAGLRGDRELRESGLPGIADHFMKSITEAVKDGRLSQADLAKAERLSRL